MNSEQMNAAQNEMINWLMHPQELGRKPFKIECAGEFDLHDLHYYIFKYKKSFIGKWLLGVCGGYENDSLENCGHIYSEMEAYNESTAVEKATSMVEMIRNYWIEQAKNAQNSSEQSENCNIELYDNTEMDAVEEHIRKYFGEFPNVFHEIVSPDVHIDICVIPPTEQRNYYTFVTMGMGAHSMDVPQELSDSKLNRAELLIYLPPDWHINDDNEQWYWPLRLLKSTARLPIHEKSWLGWGHSISSSDEKAYHDTVGFNSCMLVNPGNFGEESLYCKLPSGDNVNFYSLMPLYPEELSFKMEHGADALLDLMCSDPDVSLINLTDPKRKNYCSAETFSEEWAKKYLASLESKKQ